MEKQNYIIKLFFLFQNIKFYYENIIIRTYLILIFFKEGLLKALICLNNFLLESTKS